MKRLFSLCLVLLLLTIAGPLLAQDDDPAPRGVQQQLTLQHNDLERRYTLYVPATEDTAEPLPLLFVLHGRFGDGPSMARLTNFNERADEHGFIAVYPDGENREWNYTRDIQGYPPGPQDTDFLALLIDAVAANYPVDRERVYVAGFSNGGFMAQRLACDAPEMFANYASVAASAFGGMPGVCTNPQPLNMLLIHGTADNNILWDGNYAEYQGQRVYITYPVPETLVFWSQYIGCASDFETIDLPQVQDLETRVRVISLTDCPPGAALSLVAIIGGGHNWPGEPGKIPAQVAGQVSTELHASDVIVTFFGLSGEEPELNVTPVEEE